MNIPVRVVPVATILVFLSNCGSIDSRLLRRIEAESAPLGPAASDDVAVERTAERASQGPPEPRDVAVPDDATLDDYVALALERNPSIRRAIREVEALGYRVPQVTSLDDPMLTLVPPTGDMTQTAAGMIEATVGVRQTIPVPAKLRLRGAIAEEQVRMALATLA